MSGVDEDDDASDDDDRSAASGGSESDGEGMVGSWGGGDGGPAGLGGSMESYGSLDADYPSGRDSMERVERGADDDDLDDDDDDDEVAGAIAASPAVATPRAQTVDARLRRSTCSDISERSEPSSWGVGERASR